MTAPSLTKEEKFSKFETRYEVLAGINVQTGVVWAERSSKYPAVDDERGRLTASSFDPFENCLVSRMAGGTLAANDGREDEAGGLNLARTQPICYMYST